MTYQYSEWSVIESLRIATPNGLTVTSPDNIIGKQMWQGSGSGRRKF